MPRRNSFANGGDGKRRSHGEPKKTFHRHYHYYIYRNYQKESSQATGIKHALNVLVLGTLHRVGSSV